MKREQILERLKNEVCDITFIKVDGSIRIMKATLTEDITGMEVPVSPNTDRQNVYDIDIDAWRSFTWNNLLTVDGE